MSVAPTWVLCIAAVHYNQLNENRRRWKQVTSNKQTLMALFTCHKLHFLTNEHSQWAHSSWRLEKRRRAHNIWSRKLGIGSSSEAVQQWRRCGQGHTKCHHWQYKLNYISNTRSLCMLYMYMCANRTFLSHIAWWTFTQSTKSSAFALSNELLWRFLFGGLMYLAAREGRWS